MTAFDYSHILADLAAFGVVACILLLIFFEIRRNRKRTERMTEFARSRGLQFLGDCLPPEYPRASHWSERYWNEPRNVVFGTMDGDLVLAYEVEVPFGHRRKGIYSAMTVVARRFTTPPHPKALPPTLKVFEQAPWRAAHLVYGYFKRPAIMTPEEIDEVWRQLDTNVDR